ncbi:MAG: hypothetical protein NT049_16145 [Planctomycetota bacterium]|nr:hypothetical protein [Planctomycetota bacterium]
MKVEILDEAERDLVEGYRFYESQLSWQICFIGDPPYRPFVNR